MSPQYRRSPHLVCHWSGGSLVFENYATGARVEADALTAELLECFTDWAPAEACEDRVQAGGRGQIRRALDLLVKHSLLQRSDQRVKTAESAMKAWKDWNPAAGYFHFSTKDLEIEDDLRAVVREMKRRARELPPPPTVKRYPKAKQIALPETLREGEFPRVLRERRTWREFGAGAIRLEEVASLLQSTWGIQRWMKAMPHTRLALKTSPSGGALHSVEVYVVARRVKGLPAGIYHYAAEKNRLELLRRGVRTNDFRRYLPGQKWFHRAPVIFFMSSMWERVQWKYRFPRAYRAVLIEAGHLCQTFCLAATWLGLAPFCTMALADSKIERDLGIDGVRESVLYAAGVGRRPEHGKWRAMPPGAIGQSS